MEVDSSTYISELKNVQDDVTEIKSLLMTLIHGENSVYVRLSRIEQVLENVNFIKKAIVEGGVKVIAGILAATLISVLGGGVLYILGKGVH